MASLTVAGMARGARKAAIEFRFHGLPAAMFSSNTLFPSSASGPSTSSQSRNTSLERLVGYPNSPLLGLRHFIGGELKQLPSLAQRLLSSRHPVVENADQLFLPLRNSSCYSPGLLTLLVSKAMNAINPSIPDLDQFEITSDQRVLAEVTEMINTAHLIHSEVVNVDRERLTVDYSNGGNTNDSEDHQQVLLKELEFGNKLLIIGGDLLLARACKELALLYKPKVVGLVSQAISDIMTGVCLKDPSVSSSSQNHTQPSGFSSHIPDPSKQKSSGPVFEQQSQFSSDTSSGISSGPRICSDPVSTISPDPARQKPILFDSYYHIASLLSSSCQCCAIMAELDQPSQLLAADIGRQISILQQVFIDMDSKLSQRKQNLDIEVLGELRSIAEGAVVQSLDSLDLLPASKSRDSLMEIVCNFRTSLEDSEIS